MSEAVTRSEVAKGAALAGLARASSFIEAVAQPVYTWLFGLAGYGIYVVLWGAVNLVSNIVDLSVTNALQRLVPAERSEERAHGLVKAALILAMVPAILVAALVSANAEAVAGIFSAAPEDRATLPRMVAIFAWALPLWTFIEVATSAARARRAFGPEIRLRLFWEQLARIVFALGFWAMGFNSLGLIAAHLCSLALTALLCLRLIARFYDFKLLLRAPISGGLVWLLLGSGLAILPGAVSRRLLVDAPPVILNLMLPGARGATAAALFEIARKLSTVPLAIRQAFQYVMAPLSAAQASADRAAIEPLYRFASRVSTALVVPLSGLLIFAGADILSVYRTGAAAALPLLYLLVAARGIEAIVGPATAVVEMIGHRAFSLVNGIIALGIWAGLTALLVPRYEGVGMALAVGAATIAAAYAAAIELGFSDRLWPFDRKLFLGLFVAAAGVAVMALAASVTDGPVGFVTQLLLWAAASWCALRFGLVRSDRQAFGSVAKTLRLV